MIKGFAWVREERETLLQLCRVERLHVKESWAEVARRVSDKHHSTRTAEACRKKYKRLLLKGV